MAEFARILTQAHLEGLRREIAERPDGLIADLFRFWRPGGVPSMGNFGLRLAIRKNYLNLYQFGQSMARLSFDRRCRPIASIHPKYVLNHPKGASARDFSSSYVRVQEDQIRGKEPDLPQRYLGRDMLIAWIETARSYAGAEKVFVDRLVGFNPSVIDLEMGLPALPGERSAPRMDIVALEEVGDKIQIVFWEAKCMDNPELRAQADPGTPKGAAIFEQLSKYQDWVSVPERNHAVRAAYANTARVLVELQGLAASLESPSFPLGDVIRKAASLPADALLLDTRPRLVIEDGPKASSFEPHRKRLESYHLQIVKGHDVRPLLKGAA